MDFYTHRQVVRWVASYRYARKLLIMNGFLFILLLFSFQLFAGNGMAQKVSLKFRDAKVEEVFRELERQTGFSVFYFAKDIAAAKPISVQCASCTLTEALDAIKDGQPFEFMVTGNTIALRARPGPVVTPGETTPPDGRITGRVTDPNGAPLGGATIILKRTGMGTQANANGEFRLDGVQEEDVLLVSFTGFQQKIIKVGKGQQFPVVLEIAVKELEQFVYRGYGKTSVRELVGNVSTITSAEIAKTNVTNPMRALIGKVPNVEVSTMSGSPYAPTKIEFRGRDLIASNVAPDPLILIDGVPVNVLDLGGGSTPDGSKGIIQNGFNGPADGQDLLFNLNPDDVESITVLKDAAATAIYGSRGGSGVILITTKKGKAGKLKFDVSCNLGYSKVTKFYEMLNTSQYIEMRKEAFKNDNLIPNEFDAPDLLMWDTTRYTDYQRFLYGETGVNTNFQFSVSGGEKNTNYRVSGSFQNISNITNYSGSNKKGSVQTSFNYGSLDQRIKIGMNSIFGHTKVNEITLPVGESLLPPNAPAIFDSVGSLNYRGWDPVSYLFPFSNLLRPYTSTTDLLNSSLTIEYEIATGLKFLTNLGYSFHRNNQIRTNPIVSKDLSSNPTGGVQFGVNEGKRWIIEPTINYQNLIGKSKLELVLGGSIQKTQQSGGTTIGFGYINDNLLGSISNAATIATRDYSGQYKYAAIFGRLNYSFLGKYLIELSARRDGSSRFGPGKQYGNFWAVGAGWIFSDEKLIKSNVEWLSFGKVRASFGLVGSDNIGDYNYLSRWTANGSVINPYQGTSSYTSTQHANPDLRWQENKKAEIGLQLGFWEDRIMVNSSIYRERCGNQLLEMALSGITGFTSVVANREAVVQNSGFESEIRATILKTKNVTWNANFNIGLNRNKLLSFPNIEKTAYASILEVGQPLYRAHLLKYLGVSTETGLYMVEDRNKDGIITQASVADGGDKYFFNDVNIKYSGGFGSDFEWNGLGISVFFNYINRPQLLSAVFGNTIPGVFSATNNQSSLVMDRWRNPGDVARFAKFTTQPDASYYYVTDSDASMSNGSFIRMRYLSLSYNVPAEVLKRIKLSGARIIVKGDNLITFSKFEGVDPEIPVFGSVPTQKVLTVGLQVSL